jgi:hypothetical protein
VKSRVTHSAALPAATSSGEMFSRSKTLWTRNSRPSGAGSEGLASRPASAGAPGGEYKRVSDHALHTHQQFKNNIDVQSSLTGVALVLFGHRVTKGITNIGWACHNGDESQNFWVTEFKFSYPTRLSSPLNTKGTPYTSLAASIHYAVVRPKEENTY